MIGKALANFRERFKEGGLERIRAHYNRQYVKDILNNHIIKQKDNIARFVDHLYFREIKSHNYLGKKINFWCLVWGDEHLNYFFSYGLPSILQEGNIPRLAKEGYPMEFCLYIKEDEADEIQTKFARQIALLKNYIDVDIIILKGFTGKIDVMDKGPILQKMITSHIRKCIEENAMMISVPPDGIFGNRSMSNAVRLVNGKHVCLAVAYPRVSKKAVLSSPVFNRLKDMEITIENDELVDLAFECAHQGIANSFDNKDINATYCGHSIRKITKNVYSVVFNLPMVWVASFTKKDLIFFKKRFFNYMDKTWPRLLLMQNRLKIVGSSDLVFFVEITEDKEVPLKKNMLNNDHYLNRKDRHLQHYVSNSFYCVWRGRGN